MNTTTKIITKSPTSKKKWVIPVAISIPIGFILIIVIVIGYYLYRKRTLEKENVLEMTTTGYVKGVDNDIYFEESN